MYHNVEEHRVKAISIVLLCVFSAFVPDTISTEMFRTECQDRHFSLAVKSSFLGHVFWFDIEDSSGMHSLSSRQAAECGYTMVLNSQGDLVLRASYLACYVDVKEGSEFRLQVWFVNKKDDDKEASYPLVLTCPLRYPWSPREIVCEENYMEVSVKKQILPDSHVGLKGMAAPSMGSEEEEEGLNRGRVVFRLPAHAEAEGTPPVREETLAVGEAHLQGYHIKATDTRIVLRCAYASPLSYTLQESGIVMEAVSATMLYSHHWMLLMVDISVACTINQAVMDGTHVLWTFPQILPPLVQTGYSAWGAGIGVEGHPLTDCMIQQRGYQIGIQDGIVAIRIPFGAEGGYLKSHVVEGQYSQSYSIDLFYVHHWEDERRALTQHRSVRPLWLHIPWTPTLVNNTVPAEGMFSVTLGVFPPDMSLYNITVEGQSVSWVTAERLGLKVSHVPFSNGSHAYLLRVPFTHPLVSHKYIGGRYRSYTLAVTFTLVTSPLGETYNHPVVVVCDLQDVVLPKLEGQCTDRGIKVLLHHGNLDSQWEVYFGGHKLDWALVQRGVYVLETRQDRYSLELPLYSLGMTYEDLTLRGLVVSVHVNLVDKEKGKVENALIQRCTFPIRELLVCLPERRMVLVADTSHISPPIEPRRVTLLDPSCGPIDTDRTRALFSLSLDSCGTIRTLEDNHLVYVNEVRYSPSQYPPPDPLTPPQSQYRLPIGCRYPVKDNGSLPIYHPHPGASLTFPSRRRPVRSHRGGSQQIPVVRVGGRKTGKVYRKAKSATVKTPGPHR